MSLLASSLQVIECLKENKRKLSSQCHQKVFKLQEVEMVDSELDYQLMRVCKNMIRVSKRRKTRSVSFTLNCGHES